VAIAEIAIRSLPERVKDVRQTSFAKAALRLVPDLDVRNVDSVDNRTFIGIIGAIFLSGLIALLAINTSLTTDAFTAQHLKVKLAAINSQRDVILNQVSTYSSPNQLAASAHKLGMKPAENTNFIDLSVALP
jgi:hypothetical protein